MKLRIAILLLAAALIASGLTIFKQNHTQKPIVYTNAQYGYTITLPPSFKGFVVMKNFIMMPTHDPNWNKAGKFYAPVLEIQSTPKADVEKIVKFCGERLLKEGTWWGDCHAVSHALGDNNKYHFSYARIDKETDYPADFPKDLFNDASNAAEGLDIFDVK